MSVDCGIDGSCPFLYSCNTSTNVCEHLPVFPLTTYPIIIYCLFPICSAVCNLSGNSFGEYKVLMLMDLLNYQANEATTIAYPLITGTALYNFFNLIPKRHPFKNTSLVDYNIVMVLIPNILFGSTIGALINKFIPPVISDALILPIMAAYSVKFFLRYREYKKQEEIAKLQAQENQQSERKQTEMSNMKNIQTIRRSINTTNKEEDFEQQLKKVQAYESGLHLPHVFATIGIFIVFQTLSFLAQGKIVKFSVCSITYPIGISILTVIFIFFDLGMHRYTSNKMKFFEKIGYDYDGKLDRPKNYALVCVGGFFGGLNGGIFGIGASTTMIFTLLYMNIEPSVVSATVGFQVVFAGAASLAQAFATQSIAPNAAGLFLLETFILGGILTFFARKLLNRFSQAKVKQYLMLIVFSLVTTSCFALVASIVIGYLEFGASNMISVPFEC